MQNEWGEKYPATPTRPPGPIMHVYMCYSRAEWES